MSDIDFPGLAAFVVFLGLGAVGVSVMLVALGLRLAGRRGGPLAAAGLFMVVSAGVLAAAIEWHWLDGRVADRWLALFGAAVLAGGVVVFRLTR